MQRVLIVSERDLTPELGKTVLWRDEIDRVMLQPEECTPMAAAELQPQLVVVDGAQPELAVARINNLRSHERARDFAIAVLTSATPSAEDVEILSQARANTILPVPVEPSLWDAKLEQLLSIPSRFETRIPIHIRFWTQPQEIPPTVRGTALNVSSGGMLLCPDLRLAPGSNIDLMFKLPDQTVETSVIARVVWQRQESSGEVKAGVEFLVFRNQGRARLTQFITHAQQEPPSDLQAAADQQHRLNEIRHWEIQLRVSEARKSAILDSVPTPVITIDHEGRLIECNQAAVGLFGELPGNAQQRTDTSIITPQLLSQLRARLQRFYVLGDRHAFAEPLYAEPLTLDGVRLSMEVIARPVCIEGRSLLTLCLWELTSSGSSAKAYPELESRRSHAQKLESLGVLASGIAHDFNNLLAVIMSGAELALLEAAPDTQMSRSLLEVRSAAAHAADLTRQMLAYAGKGQVAIKPLNLSQLVLDLSQLLRSSVTKWARLETEFAEQLPAVAGDSAQLQQVVLNLITNASDAIGEQPGTIVVRTGVVQVSGDELQRMYCAELARPGEYVQLEVTDTGCGMDEKTLARIFDPFYTTKSQGRGLGLSAVLGIVKHHNGALQISSTLGRGTMVRLLLPILAAADTPDSNGVPVLESWQGNGTALLIDDEEQVRSVARRMLEYLGFSVITAHDGAHGLELYRQHSGEISMVLLDISMPRMSGYEVFAEIRELAPEAAVVLTSGYPQSEIMEHLGDVEPAGFLQKPFKLQQMIEILRTVVRPSMPDKS